MTKDTFEQNATWITRIDLDKPYEVFDETTITVLTALDGFNITSKLTPDNAHKELYEHAGITISKEVVGRHVNSQEVKINGMCIKIKNAGKVLEFKTNSASKASESFLKLKRELLNQGINIEKEVTKRCEKETCRIS